MRRLLGCCLLLLFCSPANAQGVPAISPERCQELAAQIEQHCSDVAGEWGADYCQELKAKFERLCGEVEPPPPPPPPYGCKEECRREAEANLKACLAEAGEDPAERMACHETFQQELEACIAACEPVRPTCEEKCEAAAQQAKAACEAQQGAGGGHGEPMDCEQVYTDVKASCLRHCEPQPPDNDCKRSCIQLAEEARDECKAGGGKPRECDAVFRAKLRDCLQSCDGEEPPPPPVGCPAKCGQAAREAYKTCMTPSETNPDPDPKACADQAHEALKACLEGCEDVPPFPCKDQCKFAASDAFVACVATEAADGEDPEDPTKDPSLTDDEVKACQDASAAAYDACVAACEPKPEPPTCEDRCEVHAKKLFDECIAAEDADPSDCADKAMELLAECVERCDQKPPVNCAAECAKAAQAQFEECMTPVEGQPDPDPKACREQVLAALEECRLACGIPNPPGCEERCESLYEKVYDACIADDKDPAVCEDEAAAAKAACLEGCPPHKKPCEQVCEHRIRLFVKLCEESGGENCEARAQAMLDECKKRCENPPHRPCAVRCSHVAHRAYAECIEAGGTCKDCRQQALAVLKECMMTCPPKPEPCAKQCAMAAREQFAACKDAIDVAALRAGCETAEDPEACFEAAYAAAVEACKVTVNENLAACLAECKANPPPPEPPTCEERCAKAAEWIQKICLNLKAEGDQVEGECEAIAQEFQAQCAAQCGQEPPPDPCAIDCAALAGELKAKCPVVNPDTGELDPECVQRTVEFQARCEARVAELCKEEEISDKFAPHDFLRGDANRDEKRDISDAVHILRVLFQAAGGLPCADAADTNDDAGIDISDAVRLLMHLFLGDRHLPEPLNTEGQDETADGLLCE